MKPETPRSSSAADHQIAWRSTYKWFSLFMAITFAAVGLFFLFLADDVLTFFDRFSPIFGMIPSSGEGYGFYLILAVGYMYLVTLLAVFMYREPANRYFPLLLMNAKVASSVLSFALLAFHRPYLIYLVNGVVDGLIALAVLVFYLKLRPGKA